MKIALAIFTLAVLILYLISKSRYREFLLPAEEKDFPFKALMPVSLYILDRAKFKFKTPYDRLLLSKLTHIYEPRYCQYYLRLHWANKIAALILGAAFILFVGAFSKVDGGFAVFSVSLLAGTIYLTDYGLNQKVKQKKLLIRLEFPEFINKLALLVNAGMTISRAWEKVVLDNKKTSPLYEELKIVISDMASGKPESKAYEDFAKRCRTPEASKFTAYILQNMKKGTGDLVSVLRVQSNESWETRKNIAKRLGEEASTKMLFPMMLMFISILIIVAAPAILALSEI